MPEKPYDFEYRIQSQQSTKKKKVIEDYNPFCVNALFKQYWEGFKHRNKDILRDIEIAEVEKMLSCKDENRGFWTYHCKKCNENHNIPFGCNSRICSRCGKRYADDWAESLVENTFDVPHKHIVLVCRLYYGMSYAAIGKLGR